MNGTLTLKALLSKYHSSSACSLQKYNSFKFALAQCRHHCRHNIFYRAMLCKRGLCCLVVSVRLSVTFVDQVKTNKHIFEIF